MRRPVFPRIARGLAILATVVLAIPFFAAPAAAAPSTTSTPSAGRLDAEIVRKLQSARESERIPVIVEGALNSNDGTTSTANVRRAQRAEDRVRSQGGAVVSTSNLIGATVADLTPAQIRALVVDSSVGRIHFDAEVSATAISPDDSSGTPIVYPQTIGAPEAWKDGETGTGVTVAVLDSGIDNNPAFGARVQARTDLIDPTHPAQGDPAGHGTHVAGIIAAGRNSVAPGLAPDANLVSVRVLDAQGHSRVSTVIHGLEWTIAHRKSLGIRVAVMALGAPAQGSYRDDPLAAAVELAWRSGIVVVVAAGNGGPNAGTIQTPGYDPLVLTVGASDDAGTAGQSDDSVPSWSSRGPTSDGIAKPDLVAPGRKIVGLRVPGGTLDKLIPDHIEGPRTFRLSGSSQAAAVAGGAAALLLDQRSNLSPDAVKALLVGSARPLPGVARTIQGSGNLNVARALEMRTPRAARQHVAPATPLMRAILPQIKHLVRGNQVLWDQVLWDQVLWDQVLWDQVLWDQVLWDKVNWDQVLWDQVLWDQVLWDQVLWDQVLWDQVLWDQVLWD
ncbi:MAG TPA: S8 family peptidase [Chloroflexota bacterium]